MSCVAYILRCADGTYYTGSTNDIDRRLKEHSAGRGARYTRMRLPVELIYTEEFGTLKEARAREREIKRLPRAKKTALVEKGDVKNEG
jgi:putative endonuclease